jgi:hypothetical protein
MEYVSKGMFNFPYVFRVQGVLSSQFTQRTFYLTCLFTCGDCPEKI